MRFAMLLFAVAAPLLSLGQAAVPSSLLTSMRDHDRPVLVFAGQADARVETEYAELRQHAAELQDRAMRIVFVTQSRTNEDANTPAGTVVATEVEAAALRARFHIAPNHFAVLLIGKDGGEKYRSTRVVPFATLRTLVDAMPMRQQELSLR